MTNLNIGVKGRLLLAFSGTSALALLGALAALLTFAEVEVVVDRITNERVPTTLSALDLSRQAERIAAIAPRIIADESIVDQFRTDRILRTQIGNLEKLLAQLKAGQSNSLLISEIEKSVTEIRENLGALQTFRADLLHGPPRTGKPIDPAVEAPSVLLRPSRDEMLAQGQKMIQKNIVAAGRLAAAVDRLVADQTTKIAEAKATVAATQRNSAFVLLGVVALSLVSSVLIVWLYVGRSIIGRLTVLSGSMLAIASGNLKAPLPDDRGKDEIGGMADALRIFRDKALENERLHRLKSFLAPQVAELIVTSGDESILDSHRRDVAVCSAICVASRRSRRQQSPKRSWNSCGNITSRWANWLTNSPVPLRGLPGMGSSCFSTIPFPLQNPAWRRRG
jgi:phosphoglycerate-specific signal transduction histidine kinase